MPPATDAPLPSPAPRVLLTTVYRPFCVDEPYDSVHNQVQHNAVHRQFTREQGAFAILQQTAHVGLHLIAANLDVEVDVLEYPTMEELEAVLRASAADRPYTHVGLTSPTTFLRKARRVAEKVKEILPSCVTILGGGGSLGVGELVEPFTDHVCRGDGVPFMRRLLGQDPAAPVRHPAIPCAHFPNRIMNTPGNTPSWGIATALGCDNGCEFCATSAQFGLRRTPILRSAEEILAAMRATEAEVRAAGERPSALYFVLFDENFLKDHDLARAFLDLNRTQLESGTPYLPFVFADSESVRRFTPEELLEMGVDAIWMGMEGRDTARFPKNEGADFRSLVEDLQAHGIKVILSFIAGYEDQTRRDLEEDVRYALTLAPTAFQYAMCCPMPGTALYARLKAAGRLKVDRPEQINMSHYYIDHPEMDDAFIRDWTRRFQRDDYERHGPMALRFMKLRLDGHVRHRDATRPALQARARAFRDELISAAPVLSVGTVLGPTPEVRREFRTTLGRLRREIPIRSLVSEAVKGRRSRRSVLRYAAVTHPAAEPLVRWGLALWAVRADPRSREKLAGPGGLLHLREALEAARHGMMPWDQPEPVRTRYVGGRGTRVPLSGGESGSPGQEAGSPGQEAMSP